MWLGATGVHVLAHAWKLPRLLQTAASGAPLRFAAVAAALTCGACLAVATLPAADQLQDQATAHVGLDAR